MDLQYYAQSRLLLIVTALTAALVSGCSRSDQLETARVKGVIVMDGKPVPGGHVSFIPEKGRAANGLVDSSGAFDLTTYSPGDGAIVGKHKVAVFVTDGRPTGGDIDTASLAPPRYLSAETSGLTFEVKPGEVNTFQLTLSSK